MSLPFSKTRSAFAAALLATAFALGGCVMSAEGGGDADKNAAPATDTSGRPLIKQPLSNEAIAAPGVTGEVDFSCSTDADCAIKNVGNCCGYYPACVNVDSPTFPEQVMAECAKNDMQSVCGFRDIAGCQCVEGRCSAIDAGEGPVR